MFLFLYDVKRYEKYILLIIIRFLYLSEWDREFCQFLLPFTGILKKRKPSLGTLHTCFIYKIVFFLYHDILIYKFHARKFEWNTEIFNFKFYVRGLDGVKVNFPIIKFKIFLVCTHFFFPNFYPSGEIYILFVIICKF